MQESRDLDGHAGVADDIKTFSLLLEKEKEKGKIGEREESCRISKRPFFTLDVD